MVTASGNWSFSAKRGTELTNTPAGRADLSGRYAYVRGGYAPRPKGLIAGVDGGPFTKGQISYDLPAAFPLLIGGYYRRPGEVAPAFTGRIHWIRVSEGTYRETPCPPRRRRAGRRHQAPARLHQGPRRPGPPRPRRRGHVHARGGRMGD